MEEKREETVFPAMAFALGMVAFSENIIIAFTAGILVVLAGTEAAVLGEFLERWMSGSILRGSLWILTGALTFGAFELAFVYLEMREPGTESAALLSVMGGVVGILAAEENFQKNRAARTDYGRLFAESAVVWALWICAGAAREYLGGGEIAGFYVGKPALAATVFQKPMSALLAAGIVLALACVILRKTCAQVRGSYMLVPAVFYALPLEISLGGPVLSLAVSAAVALIFLFSVWKHLEGTIRKKALEGLPSQLVSLGIIYMVLSVY